MEAFGSFATVRQTRAKLHHRKWRLLSVELNPYSGGGGGGGGRGGGETQGWAGLGRSERDR